MAVLAKCQGDKVGEVVCFYLYYCSVHFLVGFYLMALCLLCIVCGVMLLTGGRQSSIQLVALDPVCCKEQKSVAVVSPCLDLLSALIHATGCGQSPAFRVQMLEWWWPVRAQILDHLQQQKVPGQAQITVFALGHLGMELVL